MTNQMRMKQPSQHSGRPVLRPGVWFDCGLLFMFNPLPMWIFDLETLFFLEVNDAAIAHFGFSRAEFLGMTIKDIRPACEVGRLIEKLLLAVDESVPDTSLWQLRRKDGTFIASEVTWFKVMFARRPAKLVAACEANDRRDAHGHIPEEAIRALLKQAFGAQEDERRRVVRELHDEAAQTLAALLLRLRVVEEAGSLAGEAANDLRLHVLMALDSVQRISKRLRPAVLDDMGLAEAIERLGRELAETGLSVDTLAQLGDERLPVGVETVLYRIVQEALTNVRKHASARNVSIVLRLSPSRIVLIVEDDGQGFDAETLTFTRHLGLLGIRERAALLGGALLVESSPGCGTRIHISVPSKDFS